MERWMWCATMWAVAACSGCASLGSSKNDVSSTTALGECQVEFHMASGAKPKSKAVTVYDDSTVQKVLEQSGAMRKFGRMDLELARALPNGNWHKMKIDYNTRGKQVESATDYHVQPGDRLIVKENTSTIIDDMLESSLGPLSKTFGKHK